MWVRFPKPLAQSGETSAPNLGLCKMLRKLLCKMGWHKERTLMYGYPKYSNTWLTIKRCERCDLSINEWDDLFVGPRPKSFPIHKDCMNLDKRSGLTVKPAKKILSNKNTNIH